jgi:hypothetical protein
MDELCAARAHRFVVSRSLLDRARVVNVSSLGRLPSKGMGHASPRGLRDESLALRIVENLTLDGVRGTGR